MAKTLFFGKGLFLSYNAFVKKLTTVEAAEILGISRVRVFQLIQSERLPAEKVGRDWIIKEKDLELVKERKVGRPRKKSEQK
jgi:excisionase family DNA binding protein